MVDVIRTGKLGQLINVVHIEPVGYYHFAHSYVRGNWAREEDSCFSLMTKSCQCVPLRLVRRGPRDDPRSLNLSLT